MTKAKKQHPADIAAEAAMIDAIRKADHFLASIFVGVGTYKKLPAATLLGAQHCGEAFVRLNRINSRPILYAIAADGRATMITNALIERLLSMGTKQ